MNKQERTALQRAITGCGFAFVPRPDGARSHTHRRQFSQHVTCDLFERPNDWGYTVTVADAAVQSQLMGVVKSEGDLYEIISFCKALEGIIKRSAYA
jgi:hypothetical protein